MKHHIKLILLFLINCYVSASGQQTTCRLHAYKADEKNLNSAYLPIVWEETAPFYPVSPVVRVGISVPINYKGDINLTGFDLFSINQLFTCGFTPVNFYNTTYSRDNKNNRIITKAEYIGAIWAGPGIKREGYVRHCHPYSPQACQDTVSTVPQPQISNNPYPDYYSPYVRIKTPSVTTEYTLVVTSISTDAGMTSSYSYTAKIVLIIGESIPMITHYHQINDRLLFSEPYKLSETGPFKVCADGSQSSTFKLSGLGLDLSKAIIKIDGTNPTSIGSFSIISQNVDILVARYRHPNHVDPVGKFATLVATVYPTPTSPNKIMSFALNVYRPPVLMVHGLWSYPESFILMEKFLNKSNLYESNLLKKVDYSATNNREFSFNVPQIAVAINDQLKSLRVVGIAAGKVDYIGHSMGGILGRLYQQSDKYSDDIHKLITINTPHSGSEMANFLNDITHPELRNIICNELLQDFLHNNGCDGGAVTDLQVDSDVIRLTLNGPNNIKKNIIPSHAIVTLSGISSTDLDALPGLLKLFGRNRLYALGFFLYGIGQGATQNLAGSIFNNLSHDLIVSQESQRGGLTGQAWTLVEDQVHLGSPTNTTVINTVTDLLRSSPTSTKFSQSGFNPSQITYKTPLIVSAIQFTGGALEISSPTKAARFISKSVVKVIIESNLKSPQSRANYTANLSANEQISEIRTTIRYNDDSVYVAKVNAPSSSYTLTAGEKPGKYEIFVLAKTTGGRYTTANSYFTVDSSLDNDKCESLQSGDWSNASTWSCGRVPTDNDLVVINSSHIITISVNTARARNVLVKGGKINYSSIGSRLYIRGN